MWCSFVVASDIIFDRYASRMPGARWMETTPDQKQKEPRSSCGLQPPRSAVQSQPSRKRGAIRMARLRDRRQRGFRVYQLEVYDADIEGLISHGLLDRLQCDNPTAVESAIGSLLDRLTR